MNTFLKRRWVLLLCALILGICTTFDISRTSHRPRGTQALRVGLSRGSFFYWKVYGLDRNSTCNVGVVKGSHKPMLGGLPRLEFKNPIFIAVPLWLPLSATLGWLVLRELRWREKQVKETAATP
jgi:hypothetical protein